MRGIPILREIIFNKKTLRPIRTHVDSTTIGVGEYSLVVFPAGPYRIIPEYTPPPIEMVKAPILPR